MGLLKNKNTQETETELPERKKSYINRSKVPIPHPFKSPILYLAIGLFILTQLYTFIILIASESTGNRQTTFAVISIIAAIIIVTLAFLLNQKIHEHEWTVPFNLTIMIQVIFMLFGLILFSTIIAPYLPQHTQPNQDSLSSVLMNQPITMGIYIAIVAPVVEEIVFREAIPSAFGYSKWSYLATGLIFTLLHSPAGLVGWISYGSLSAIFTFARIKGGAVKFSIVSHIAWNTMTLLISLLVAKGG